MKGLPLSYGRDLQEDKALVFSVWTKLRAGLVGVRSLLAHLDFDEARLAEAARDGATWATDLAEALVARGVPFRDAHRVVGRLVATLQRRGADLADATVEELKAHHRALRASDRALADPRARVHNRRARGGPAPGPVRAQIETLRAAAHQLRT